MGLVIDHWRRLDAAAHPDDTVVLGAQPQSFNFDYPPPAYLGDVENAPFVVLMLNGGYDPVITQKEVPDNGAVARYMDLLHHPGPSIHSASRPITMPASSKIRITLKSEPISGMEGRRIAVSDKRSSLAMASVIGTLRLTVDYTRPLQLVGTACTLMSVRQASTSAGFPITKRNFSVSGVESQSSVDTAPSAVRIGQAAITSHALSP